MKTASVVLSLLLLAATANCAFADISIHLVDFISDSQRTHFSGFEDIVPEILLTNFVSPFTHSENGLLVSQIHPDDSIFASYTYWGAEGLRSWYPNGGDDGYTVISLASGGDFDNLGFLRGSGADHKDILVYELYDDGELVKSGTVSHQRNAQYLGFSGGGFDEVHLRDATFGLPDIRNHLVIDSVETSGVPEPSSLAILAVLAAPATMIRFRRRRTIS